MLKTGVIIDNRYRILREIGRGGTGCVYLAENVRLHNYWAIKEVYKSGIHGNTMRSGVLIAESNILTKLRHPGLPSIVDIMVTAQSYLIVMEYIEGISLDKVLAQRGPQSEENVIKWGKQLCDVLHYLHTRKPAIIYRDMKPSNIMLKPDGNIVLIDFGMAREFKELSRHDTTNLGTHGYAAPEQYNGSRQTDARTDIYSLGVTLYHLVTGHDPCIPPYGIRPIRSIRPSLSPKLEQIILKCTQLNPQMRYQSAKELEHDLNQVDFRQIVMDFHEEDSKEHEGKKSNKWIFAVIPVVLVFVIAIVVVIATLFNSPDRHPSDSYQEEVYIAYEDQRQYYYFIPEESGVYHIYSESGRQMPIIWLTDEEDNLLVANNTSGEYSEFEIYYWLEAEKTYYIETTLYDLDPGVTGTGHFWIYIELT